MTPPGQAFPFLEREAGIGAASLAPMVPLTLKGVNTPQVHGLLDTGASVNVLPYQVGEQLGLVWEQQSTPVVLTGNLASLEARALVLMAEVGDFSPVRLVFAWTRGDSVPVILGQVNFFLEFDVCLYRSRSFLELRPKVARGG